MATTKDIKASKNHKIFFYITILLIGVVVILAAFVVTPARCKEVQLEEAVPYTEEEAYLVTEETEVPLKYGSYYYVLPTYYNWTHYTIIKVYVKNIDEKTGYFTTHLNISNSTHTIYQNLTYPIEKNKEVLYYFEFEEGQKDQNVTADYWIAPGTQKKTTTYTKYRNVTKYEVQKVNKTVCV